VGVAQKPVEDAVGDRRLGDDVMPLTHGNLCGDDDRLPSVTGSSDPSALPERKRADR